MWAKFADFFKFDGCTDDKRETAVPFHADPATGGLICSLAWLTGRTGGTR